MFAARIGSLCLDVIMIGCQAQFQFGHAYLLAAARAHSEARRLPAQLSQGGQDGSGVANAHCAQSGFTQGESASQHFHCRDSHIAAPAGTREGRQKRDAERRTDGRKKRSCGSHPSPSTAPMRLSLRLSPNFSTLPRPFCWLHATSPSPAPLPHLPLPPPASLRFSLPSPTPLVTPPPPSLSIPRLGGVYADSGTFFSQSVCEDQTKVLQCRLRQRVCM